MTKNRQNKEGGGVAILVRNDLVTKTNTIKNLEDQDQEILWLRMNITKHPLIIGIFYGPQENAPQEEIERQYSQITTQINKLKRKGDIILTGDFNAKLKITTPKIKQDQSKNGKFLSKLLKQTNMTAISTKKEYVQWTRENRKNPSEKSIIDYILISNNLAPQIENIEIDTKQIHTLKGKELTDHNTIITHTKIKTTSKANKVTRWNLNNDQEWIQFNDILTNKVTDTKDCSYNKLQNLITQTLEETIGKITINTNKIHIPRDPKTRQLQKERKIQRRNIKKIIKNNPEQKQIAMNKYIDIQKQLQKHIETTQKTITENTIKKTIKETKKNPNYFWKIRKKLKNMESNSIPYQLITEEDKTIEDPTEAKKYIANYFQELYKARDGTTEYQHWTDHITDTVNTLQLAIPTDHNPNNNITPQELHKAIRSLKTRKAVGPDNIPNEALIYSNTYIKDTLLKQFNHILQNRKVPKQWQTSTITRIYKGKGTKGKCSSERGITLSSNIGKTFERIINNRIQKQINITDAQAGGQKGRATTDHIMTLYDILMVPPKSKSLYVTFLDVTKAFDKAWNDAIMYTMNNNGAKHPEWIIMKKLNENLTARINTNHGLTDTIQITNSIRQGGVLSGTQYALLIDEINKELTKENLGIHLPNTKQKIPALLWMDDIVLITDNKREMEQMLNTTNHIALKYHIEFGQEKSQIMILRPHKNHANEDQFYLGNKALSKTTTYKYLGVTLNNKLTASDHINKIKSKTEAAYQSIMTILHDQNFAAIQMRTAWKLLKTCLLPIITHSLEAINLRQTDYKELNKIWESMVKRILKTPISTPTESLYIETGLIDVQTTIERNRLRMASRLLKNKTKLMNTIKQENTPKGWWMKTEEIMTKYQITYQDLQQTKNISGKTIKERTAKLFETQINERSQTKSKMQHLFHTNHTWSVEKPQVYTSKLPRNLMSTIFKTRTRMLKIKHNYKNAYTNLICRMCKSEQETQDHILSKCPAIHHTTANIITPEKYFSDNTNTLKNTANSINNIMSLLSETP